MKKTNVKSKISSIAIILVLTISAILVSLPAIFAQPITTTKTYPVIGATPNPVGVNQETLLLLGITQQAQQAEDGWENLTITVTNPLGETETLGPFRTDSTGLTGALYRPTMVGTYYLQLHFPRQFYNYTGFSFWGLLIINTWMEASTSEKIELIVQEEPVTHYPAHALPTEYWTRPIDAQHREWMSIAGSWLETPDNFFAPYNDDAPETAHILWVNRLTTGGLVGGDLGEHAFEGGDAYEGKWGAGFFGGGNPLIIAGKLYYEKYSGSDVYKETACVDLHTGEELWSGPLLDNRTFTRGQLMYWDTYDFHGVYDYLWVQVGGGFFDPTPPTWQAFDPFTGDWVYALENLPSGTLVYGPKGELLTYTVNRNAGWMTQWNSTSIPELYASTQTGTMGWGQWQPMGKTANATGPTVTTPITPLGLNGYNWNVTIPTGLPGSVQGVFVQDKVVGVSISSTQVTAWALSLEPGKEGTLLYNKTWQAPAEWATGNLTISFGTISGEDGAFTINTKEDRKRYGFSTNTGDYLWVISEPLGQLDYLTGGFPGESGAIAYGKLFSGTVSGILKAYDITTGELVWKYEAYDPLNQILWSNNWPIEYLFITDGKIYLAHSEHSPIDPMPRGAPFICVNATDGTEIWRINGAFRGTVWGGKAIIGDSIIATMDTYDQRIYAIGKGPSATTVKAPETTVSVGTDVLVTGTVMDMSPGTKDIDQTLRFPNGVPAVSDESMSEWMLYVYKQYPVPEMAMGVDVAISVLDPNGNTYEMGTHATDNSGKYGLTFKPEIEGLHLIIASFAGTGGYYSSYATTYLSVDPAPEPYPTVEIPPYPGYQGPSAGEVAQNVLDSLPDDPTADEIAQEVLDQLPEYPEAPEAPEYTTVDLILIVAVIVVAALVVYNIYSDRKRR